MKTTMRFIPFMCLSMIGVSLLQYSDLANATSDCQSLIEQDYRRLESWFSKEVRQQDGDAAFIPPQNLEKLIEEVALLETQCSSFYALLRFKGELFKAQQDFSSADLSYQQAFIHAPTPKDQATLLLERANLLEQQDNLVQAMNLTYDGIKLMEDKVPMSWLEKAHALEARINISTSIAQLSQGEKNRLRGACTGPKCAAEILKTPIWLRSGIQFEKNSPRILPDNQPRLKRLANALDTHVLDEYVVKIVGHTCRLGQDSYNRILSNERAQNLYRALTQINPKLKHQLLVEGRGDTDLLYSGSDLDNFDINRRVTIELIPRS